MNTLAAQIRARRVSLGLTRAQMAHLFEPPIDPQNIYRWETGGPISEKRRPRIAEILGGEYVLPKFVFSDNGGEGEP